MLSIGLLYEDKSCLPNTWLPKWTNWMRNEVSSSNPIPPENVAIAIGWPLNNFLKSSPDIESHAMKFERMGGIDPLYSGAQITHLSIDKSFFLIVCISNGILSLLWIRGLKSGMSRVVRSNISELIWSSLLFSKNFSESSRFFPQLAEMIIKSFDSVVNSINKFNS